MLSTSRPATALLCHEGEVQAAAYAQEISAWVRQAALDADMVRLGQALKLAPHAARAHPSTEHFMPLLVAAGAADKTCPVTVLNGGIRHGVLAMESYVVGQQWGLDVQDPDTA